MMIKNHSRTRLLFPLFALLLATIMGCESNQPIKVGFVGGTSGRVADLGISGRDAVRLVIDQTNATGGINGRQIILIQKDDRQDPERARQVVRELLDEGVGVIIGPMTSDMSIAVLPLLNESRVVAVSPTSTTQELSGKDDYFFRVSSTTREYAGKSAQYHAKSGIIKRMAVAYDLNNRSFCENWLLNFTAGFTSAGGEIIDALGFDTRSNESLLDLARALIQKNPDGILVIANSMDAALICQQVRKLDSKVHLTLADWGATERLLELGGKAVEGVTVIQTFDRNSQAPPYREFRQAYLDRYQREPGFPGVYSYDATKVVIEILKQSKKPGSLKETILEVREFEGLQGKFSFDDFGDVKRSNASISVVRNGSFIVIE